MVRHYYYYLLYGSCCCGPLMVTSSSGYILWRQQAPAQLHQLPVALHLPASSSSTRIFKFRLSSPVRSDTSSMYCWTRSRWCHSCLRANWLPHLLLYAGASMTLCLNYVAMDAIDYYLLYDCMTLLYCNAKLGIFGVGSPTGSPRAWHREMSMF